MQEVENKAININLLKIMYDEVYQVYNSILYKNEDKYIVLDKYSNKRFEYSKNNSLAKYIRVGCRNYNIHTNEKFDRIMIFENTTSKDIVIYDCEECKEVIIDKDNKITLSNFDNSIDWYENLMVIKIDETIKIFRVESNEAHNIGTVTNLDTAIGYGICPQITKEDNLYKIKYKFKYRRSDSKSEYSYIETWIEKDTYNILYKCISLDNIFNDDIRVELIKNSSYRGGFDYNIIKNGNIILNNISCYTKTREQQNIIKYRKDDREGLIDNTGNILIEAEYDSIEYIYKDLYLAINKDLYLAINKDLVQVKKKLININNKLTIDNINSINYLNVKIPILQIIFDDYSVKYLYNGTELEDSLLNIFKYFNVEVNKYYTTTYRFIINNTYVIINDKFIDIDKSFYKELDGYGWEKKQCI